MILCLAGWILGDLAARGDVLLYTVVLVAATAAVAVVVKRLGPIQKADERAVRRSEEAALTAVRVCMIVGAFGSIYAKMLGAPSAAVAFATGMVVPAIIWFVVYWILNWRDVV